MHSAHTNLNCPKATHRHKIHPFIHWLIDWLILINWIYKETHFSFCVCSWELGGLPFLSSCSFFPFIINSIQIKSSEVKAIISVPRFLVPSASFFPSYLYLSLTFPFSRTFSAPKHSSSILKERNATKWLRLTPPPSLFNHCLWMPQLTADLMTSLCLILSELAPLSLDLLSNFALILLNLIRLLSTVDQPLLPSPRLLRRRRLSQAPIW